MILQVFISINPLEIYTEHLEINSLLLESPSCHLEINSCHLEPISCFLECDSQPLEINSQPLEFATDSLEIKPRHLEIKHQSLEIHSHVLEAKSWLSEVISCILERRSSSSIENIKQLKGHSWYYSAKFATYNMKALLLAAGLGTRLKPFTDNHPKALAPVNGHSLLEINIRNLQKFGIYDVVVNVHHFASQIIEILQGENGFGSRVQISDESDEVLETGGGLKKAAPFFEGEKDFLVMNVDMLTNANFEAIIREHQSQEALATLAVQQRSSSRYFLFDDAMQLKGWENVSTGERKPAKIEGFTKQYAFSGIQVLNQKVFSKIKREGKFSLVDVYLDLCASEKIIGLDHSGDLLLDVGKPESLTKASQLFKDIF